MSKSPPWSPSRRAVLAAAGGVVAGGLARPAIAQGTRASTLRFIPQADVPILDPLNTSAYPTRTHGHLCWDTLYGIDEHFVPQPQLAAGHTVEDDGRRWVFTLRDGPTFHDGEKVLARDAVASIQRWMLRDTHGQTLAKALDEIRVLDDRRFEMRLKKPFGTLLDALAKASSYPCFVYPERFAKLDPSRAFTEVVGSGPYRFVASERVSGAQLVYQRYDRYVPTPVGSPSMIAGPKLAHFERQEWKIISDSGTAAAAIQAAEIDWWELVPNDLEPLLKAARGITLDQIDQGGIYAALRFNHLLPPFDDPAVRRALLQAVTQSDFMIATAGEEKSAWRDGVGFFPSASPYASEAGLEALTKPRDIAAAKAAIAAAGKGGAKIATLHATDVPSQNALMLVGADMLQRAGFAVDDQTVDWGTLLQRRATKQAGPGGWNALIALFSGTDLATPASNLLLRANGNDAWFGWPTSPKLEALRDAWFDATDAGTLKDLGRQIQAQAFLDVPYVPLGQYFSKSAYRSDLKDVRQGIIVPLNVRRG